MTNCFSGRVETNAHPSILIHSKGQDPVDWLGNEVVDIDPAEGKLTVRIHWWADTPYGWTDFEN